jgi:hypothetical protein
MTAQQTRSEENEERSRQATHLVSVLEHAVVRGVDVRQQQPRRHALRQRGEDALHLRAQVHNVACVH